MTGERARSMNPGWAVLDCIEPAAWSVNKTEAFDPASASWWWIDDNPSEHDQNWLCPTVGRIGLSRSAATAIPMRCTMRSHDCPPPRANSTCRAEPGRAGCLVFEQVRDKLPCSCAMKHASRIHRKCATANRETCRRES